MVTGQIDTCITFSFAVPAEDLIASTRQVEVQDLEPSTMKKELSMNIGSDATVLSGKVVVLRCPTQGSIKPKITWYSGNKMISSDENHVITDDSLIIKEQREGVYDYKCKAETFLGSTEMASKVKIVGE